jgi:hypothetical protein
MQNFDPLSVTQVITGSAFRKAIEGLATYKAQIGIIKPTPTDLLLKNSLWNEIRKYEFTRTPVPPGHVYEGICTRAHWNNGVLKNPTRLNWLLEPGLKANEVARYLELPVINRLLQVSQVPAITDGKVDSHQVDILIKILRGLGEYRE